MAWPAQAYRYKVDRWEATPSTSTSYFRLYCLMTVYSSVNLASGTLNFTFFADKSPSA